MKRKVNLFCVLFVLIGCLGCMSGYLNAYHTDYDRFLGVMEKGKVFEYSNKLFDIHYRFKVIQVIENNKILIHRPEYEIIQSGGVAVPYGCGLYGTISEGRRKKMGDDMFFLVFSNHSYAEGDYLKDGFYKCLGTYTYTSKGGDEKTVYALEETNEKNK